MENKCSGKCEDCSINQRTYCASQMAYYAQQEIAEIKAMLASSSMKVENEEIVVLRKEEVIEVIEDETDFETEGEIEDEA